MNYIRTGRIQTILGQAAEQNCTLYIMGPIGCGKTAAVEYYYRRTAHHVVDCSTGVIAEKTDPSRIRAGTIIIDNVTYLTDEASRKYVLDLLRTGKHIVFTARAPRPSWLVGGSFEQDLMMCDHRDMIMQKDNVRKFLESYDTYPSEDDLMTIMEVSKGNALYLKYIAFHMRDNESYTDELGALAKRSFYNYLDSELCGWITEDEMEVLLSLCTYPSFTFRMARQICDNPDCQKMIDSISRKNAYVFETAQKVNYIREEVRRYLLSLRMFRWPVEKNRDNLHRGAEYYLQEGKTKDALGCYKMAGDSKEIFALLEQTAESHPDIGSVYEMRDYYLKLSDDEIRSSWTLMSVISLLSSLLVKPKMSEKWYRLLKEAYERETDEYVRDRIHKRIIYLDLVLPHRGSKNLYERCKAAADEFTGLISPSDIMLADMMPTSLKSTIDVSEYVKDKEHLFGVIESIIRSVSPDNSLGIIDIMKAEIGYETDSMDHFELLTLLNRGYVSEDADNSYSGCFAAIGVSVRLHLYRGEMEKAEELLDSIREKAVRNKNDVLLKNIDALYSWVDQLHTNRENISGWLEEAVDEGVEFSFLDRTELLSKVRAYIILGRFDFALPLIERLLAFCDMYDRVYSKYEVLLYKAIAYYRIKKPEWQDIMNEVWAKAYELGFYRIISDHGAAVLPLINKNKPDFISKDFFDHTVRLTRQMAENYPNYLVTPGELKEPLTRTERRVLHLLCEGLNADEICNLMGISYSGIKFHNKNIYRKLGVSNRTEAVRMAYRLGINETGMY